MSESDLRCFGWSLMSQFYPTGIAAQTITPPDFAGGVLSLLAYASAVAITRSQSGLEET
jgi:hypothetical protein